MINRSYVQQMARYYCWQNENLYGVADRLPADERARERGAWFGSIHKTLSHILWGDKSWMGRFTDLPRPTVGIPESGTLFPDWEELKAARVAFDRKILDWADSVEDNWLAADQTYYSGATKREWTRPRWVLVTMLTQAGGRPSDTDLPFMPDQAP
jgi:uncharacterized damage-inducible protein DinB